MTSLRHGQGTMRECRTVPDSALDPTQRTVTDVAVGDSGDADNHHVRVGKRFTDIVRSTDVSYLTLHGLRHTHATHLLAMGQNPRMVSERLGHADVAFTLQVYGHVLPGHQREAAEAAAGLLE
jgi:integrase